MKKLKKDYNYFLKILKEGRKINGTGYNNLRTKGAKPGILYALPKIHKANTPMRPIGTYNYKLGKYLVPMIDYLANKGLDSS